MTRCKLHFDFPQNRPSNKWLLWGVLRASLPGLSSISGLQPENVRVSTSPLWEFDVFVKMTLRKHMLFFFISWECCHFRPWSQLWLPITIYLHWGHWKWEGKTILPGPALEVEGFHALVLNLSVPCRGTLCFLPVLPTHLDLGIVKAVPVSQGDFLLINGLLTAENGWMWCKTLY